MEIDSPMMPVGPFCPLDGTNIGAVVIPRVEDHIEYLRDVLSSPLFRRRERRVAQPVPELSAETSARDAHVRVVLLEELRRTKPQTRIVEEMVLFSGESDARVDIAVLGRELHGFEIKSAADTLTRLRRQEAVYSACLDRVTLVVDQSHCVDVEALKLIPSWWGIVEVVRVGPSRLRLRPTRKALRNPTPRAEAFVRLLWQSELQSILLAQGKRFEKRSTCASLRQQLVSEVPHLVIRRLGLHLMRVRTRWRLEPQKVQSST